MSKRIVWIDNVRAIGCILVILLHVSAYHLYKIKDFNSFDWFFSNIIDSLARVCVPLFFMISGFIFMKNKDVKIKNIFKIFLNLVFYSAISYMYLLYFGFSKITQLSTIDAFIYFFKKPVFFHLWFFYQLLVCYFFFCLLSVKDICYKKALIISSIVFIIFNGKTSSFTSLFFDFGFYGSFVTNDDIPFYLLYSALGACLGSSNITIKNKSLLIMLYLFISTLTAIFTFLVSNKNGKFTESFFTYSSILVMWASVLLFIYIKNIDTPVFGSATNAIASATLPIYGLHPLILEYLITNNYRITSAPLDIILITCLTFLICLLVGMIINKLDRWKLLS